MTPTLITIFFLTIKELFCLSLAKFLHRNRFQMAQTLSQKASVVVDWVDAMFKVPLTQDKFQIQNAALQNWRSEFLMGTLSFDIFFFILEDKSHQI